MEEECFRKRDLKINLWRGEGIVRNLVLSPPAVTGSWEVGQAPLRISLLEVVCPPSHYKNLSSSRRQVDAEGTLSIGAAFLESHHQNPWKTTQFLPLSK